MPTKMSRVEQFEFDPISKETAKLVLVFIFSLCASVAFLLLFTQGIEGNPFEIPSWVILTGFSLSIVSGTLFWIVSRFRK